MKQLLSHIKIKEAIPSHNMTQGCISSMMNQVTLLAIVGVVKKLLTMHDWMINIIIMHFLSLIEALTLTLASGSLIRGSHST